MELEVFKEHIIFTRLEQLQSSITDKKTSDELDINELKNIKDAISYITDGLKLTIPSLTQKAVLDQIATELNNAQQQLNNFVGNKNPGHLTNVNTHLGGALSKIRTLPIPYKAKDVNFTKVLGEFQRNVFEEYEKLHKANKNYKTKVIELEEKLTNVTEELTNLVAQRKQELEDLETAISEKNSELEKIQESHKATFEELREEYQEVLDNDRVSFEDKYNTEKDKVDTVISNVQGELDGASSSIIDSLRLKLKEAEKIVNVVGNVGVTGNYKLIANEHKSSANFWRWVAVAFMACLSGLLVWTIIDLSTQEFNWIKSLLRIVSAIALSYPATYAARESNKHRKLETINRTAELELASINPFIELLDDTKKQEIKSKLVDKYFGNNISVDYEKGDDFSIGALDKVIKIIKPLISK